MRSSVIASTGSRVLRSATLPARYADAARAIRRARAVAPSASFEEAFAFASEVGITQEPDEIRWLFELVRAERAQAVLEIGLDEGGTLFLWTRAAGPDALLMAIDTRPPGALGMRSPFPLARRNFAHSSQRVELLMPADSHDPATRGRVESLLGGRKLDLLFIDGDHSREGVWADFELYSPLVRAGGIVAFHDVSEITYPAVQGVRDFWREFKRDHETAERVLGAGPGYGIGVYRLPG
jgi:predicted O-methyltransferase YrrM